MDAIPVQPAYWFYGRSFTGLEECNSLTLPNELNHQLTFSQNQLVFMCEDGFI